MSTSNDHKPLCLSLSSKGQKILLRWDSIDCMVMEDSGSLKISVKGETVVTDGEVAQKIWSVWVGSFSLHPSL